ncbi:MAG: hypothetical protein ACPLRA_03230, partial [Candidatus Saccharicenans sp.]
MVCILIMAVFLTLGAGLLINSRIFLQTQGFRKLVRLCDYAAENGIKQALNQIQTGIENNFAELEIEESQVNELREKLRSGQLPIIRPLIEQAALSIQDDISGMSWQTSADSHPSEIFFDDHYVKATFGLNIKSAGRVQGFSGKRSEELQFELTLMAGHLPLNQLPAVVEKEGLDDQVINQLSISSRDPANLAPKQLKSVSGSFIPDDALPLISRGLKILRPEKLPNWLLRQALGLELSNESVPEGVYLIHDDLGLGGIYVQGDLDELLFGPDNGFQLIQFRQEDKLWLLKFNPATQSTYFFSAESCQEFNELPIPIIMINGQVKSLASGKPDSSEYLIPSYDEL